MIKALITEINNSSEHWSLIRQDTFEAAACDGKYISAHILRYHHTQIFLFTTHQGLDSTVFLVLEVTFINILETDASKND